ncbi:hypothetical protein [Dyadobacter sp. Leaf189]|uniref:hypothetical protein n=1 Tax=Dyadobacter sp. Leaf189 TaxID=1736295 RepID=UPI0006F2F771|nr:hypothetical protein [Dyadobacter sp. Leaf189]KQS27898.1 hypothetical protein ASG33_15920 [Dyadobacter sp. Leaf189]
MIKLFIALGALALCCCTGSEKPIDNDTVLLTDSIGLYAQPPFSPNTKVTHLLSDIPKSMDSVLNRLSPRERKLYIKHMTKFYNDLEETSKNAYVSASPRK